MNLRGPGRKQINEQTDPMSEKDFAGTPPFLHTYKWRMRPDDGCLDL